MEQQLMYLILAGWLLMIFLPSILPALILAAALGGAAAYLVFIGNGGEGDLQSIAMYVAPMAGGAIFAAWPFGAFIRWVIRPKNKHSFR